MSGDSRCRGSSTLFLTFTAHRLSDRQVIPHQHQNGGLGNDQIFLLLERDLDRGLAKENCVVSHPGLHAPSAGFSAIDLPGLLVQRAQVCHRSSRTGGNDESGLHLLGIDGRGRQVEPHPGPLVAVLRGDQHPVADDKKLLLGELHQRFPLGSAVPRALSSSASSAWCTVTNPVIRSLRLAAGSRRFTSSPTWQLESARPRGDAREIWPASISIISASTTT